MFLVRHYLTTGTAMSAMLIICKRHGATTLTNLRSYVAATTSFLYWRHP